MKKLIFLLILTLGACAPKITPPVDIPKAPRVVESVKPSLEKVQKGIDSAIDENTRLNDRIKDQKQGVLDQRINISEALAQAEKIKEKALAKQALTELEALNLAVVLKKIQTDNQGLEKHVKELEDGNYQQSTVLQLTRVQVRETMAKLEDKEHEASELRSQNSFLADALTKKNAEIVKVQKDNLKLSKEVATNAVYKMWIIIGVITIVVLGVGYILIRIYIPSFKI